MSDSAPALVSVLSAATDQQESIANLIWTVAALSTVFIALLSFQLKSKDVSEAKLRRAERLVLGLVYMAGITVGGLAILFAPNYEHRWGLLLAFLPYLLIVQHATFLQIVRRPVLRPMRRSNAPGKPGSPGGDQSPSGAVAPVDNDADNHWWASVLQNARATTDRYFGPVSLTVRYGTAAMAVLLIGLTAFLVLFGDDPVIPKNLFPPANNPTRAGYMHAAQLGLGGAYVYVLVHLGRRNFTHDVTSGGAIWCGIVLAVGPLLAAILAYLLQGSDGTLPAADRYGVNLIYFMAGFSPRFVIAFMEEAARRAWAPAASSVASPRTVPATQAAGVTPEIAERLTEEGIFDLHGLAMADPLRLIRNTNFDRREIVSWIDEAILIDMFPEHWRAFEREGVCGAVDLVSLVYPPPYKQYRGEDDAAMKTERDGYLDVLCRHLKLSEKPADDVQTIRSIARRLVNDAQLRLIWVLHNHIADSGESDEVPNAPPIAPAAIKA